MTSTTLAAPVVPVSAPMARQKVGEALWDLFRVISIRGQADCRGLGLTLAQGKLLIMLGASASWEPSELARKLDLSRQAMSSAVNHLEREGLVQRIHSPTDRRRIYVRFTPRGRRTYLKLRADHHALHERINRLFSGPERESAVRVLIDIRRALAGTPEVPPYRCALCSPGQNVSVRIR